MELLPSESAEYITKNLEIPTIGIGAGVGCDGQIVVTDDIIGKYTDFVPKFVKRYANVYENVSHAVECYVKDVKSLAFPAEEQSFQLNKDELCKLGK